MNSCETYQELISRLVDGEISHDEYDALMAHMESCSRCSAMYAVFHDLSDVLAGEAEEPLPDGLHENIMAGVRRSAIEKKNRRMRSIGLRTALTAAACAVLVLFAALGFAPHERAENVTIRSEQAAEEILPDRAAPTPVVTVAPAPATQAPQQTAAPAAAAPATPAVTPMPEPKAESAASPAAAAEDAYLAAGSAADQAQDLHLAEEPVAQSAGPAADLNIVDATASAAAPAPENRHEAPAEPTAAAETATTGPAPAEPAAESAAPEEVAAAESPAPAGETPKPSLFSGISSLFHAAAPDTASTPETASAPEGEAAPEKTAAPLPPRPEKKDDQLDSYSIRKKEQFTALLALLGEKEEKLPDAALTRSICVSYLPEDAYDSGEKLEIRLYDDFVYYTRSKADGSILSYRADCSVSSLEEYLNSLSAGSPTATPAPTADPFAAASPAAEDLTVSGQH